MTQSSSPRAGVTGDPADRPVPEWFLITALAVTMAVVALHTSVVIPVLGPIAEQLDVSRSAASWVLSANLLAATVFTPLIGKFGDLYGNRPVLLGVLVVVLIGSIISLVATSLAWLLVGRVLQAACFGLFALLISIMHRTVEPGRLHVRISVVASMNGLGGLVGIVAAGLLTSGGGSYRPAFAVVALWVAIALVLCWLTVPRTPAAGRALRLDWIGAAGLIAALVALLLPITQGNRWGWTSPGTLGCLALSVVLFVLWVSWERRCAEPLVVIAQLASRRLLVPHLAGFFTGVTMYLSMIAMLGFVEIDRAVAGYGLSASILEATVVYLAPSGIVGLAAAPFIGRAIGRYGAREVLAAGSVVGVAGFAWLAILPSAAWEVVAAMCVLQLFNGIAFATVPSLVSAAVAPSQTGIANSINSIARGVGSAVASAFTVAMLVTLVDDRTGLASAGAFTLLFGVGGVSCALVAVGAWFGLARTHPART